MRNRFYSLAVPWFGDAAMALTMTAMPMLAVGLGVNEATLGLMGAAGQLLRLPLTMISGNLSERVGRANVIVPAAIVIALSAIGLAFTNSVSGIFLFYTLALGSFGVFYPPLQALIGDVSQPKRLRKNLGAFGIGWCVGGALAGLAAGWLVRYGLSKPFFAAACSALVAGTLVIIWSRTSKPYTPEAADAAAEQIATQPCRVSQRHLLLISRMGLVTGVFGVAAVGILFTPIGVKLGWSGSEVASIRAMVLVGQAAAVLSTYASAWWRGKLWPQMASQSMMLLCGVVICLVSSKLALGLAFFGIGFAHGVAYTAALYHGILCGTSNGTSKGKQGGIHESLVACGHISGNLLGGLVAQWIWPRAPYATLSLMALGCLIATASIAISSRRAGYSGA